MKKLSSLLLFAALCVPPLAVLADHPTDHPVKNTACEVACEKQKKKCYTKAKGRMGKIACDKARKKCVKKCKK